MKDTKFRILLDIHEVRSQATIPVKVGDVSCKIYITLVEGGKPYKIHENSFGVFTGKKGDNNPIFNNCIIENGIIRYDFTPQTVAAAGVLECEIRIYDEDGGVLTTPSFNIVVDERAVNDSELASTPEFAFLDEILVNEGQRIENERNRNEAFNNLGIDLEDDGEVISIVKTDIDGSQEKASFLKYADVIPPVTATASGSAITIDSANAPLQALKLYGKTTQDGTPTPDNPIELKSVGDSGSFEVGVYGGNLFNPTLETKTENGITITKNGDGTYTLNGSNPNAQVQFILGTVTLPKGTYKMVGNVVSNNELYLSGYVGQDKGNGVVLTFEEDVTNRNVLYFIPQNTTLNNVVIKPMLTMNLKATYNDFTPYTKQTLTMPYTLRSVGDIKDEVDFTRGVLIQRCLSVTNFVWSNALTHTVKYTATATKPLKGAVAGAPYNICSHTGVYEYSQADKVHFFVQGDGLGVWLPDDTEVTEIEVIGVLATPQEIPLTETELNAYRQLMTNKGNTTILSEADMEVDYYINKPNAQTIGNIHSQINKDYFKLQQAIISTGGN